MDLKRAKLNCDYPELALVLIWESWISYTDINLDALKYIVKNSSRILLPNVKVLSVDKLELLRTYKGYIDIGIKL